MVKIRYFDDLNVQKYEYFMPIQAFKRTLLFPTFLICSYLPYFFLKMPYYPYFFTVKCHLRVKIQKYFLDRLARSDFIN